MLLLLGILFGFFAATGQSVAYVFSRGFSLRAGGGPIMLLVMSHVLLALLCFPAMLLLWPTGFTPDTRWVLLVLLLSWAYLAGHACFMQALRYTSASRVSPLLGLKIAIVALLTVTALNDSLGPWQWLAVALAVVSAFALNYTGGSIPLPALAAVLGACFGYSCSDVGIRLMVEATTGVPLLHAAVFGMAAAYTVCGLTLAPFLPWAGSRNPRQWRAVVPYSAAWMLGMVFLFMSYAAAGPVLGNIVQSSRGLISLALGALIAAQGLHHLEAHVAPMIFWRRVAAAFLMAAAVALYAFDELTRQLT